MNIVTRTHAKNHFQLQFLIKYGLFSELNFIDISICRVYTATCVKNIQNYRENSLKHVGSVTQYLHYTLYLRKFNEHIKLTRTSLKLFPSAARVRDGELNFSFTFSTYTTHRVG